MSTFSDPIIGGDDGTALVRAAIKSPDYQPDVAGWSLDKTGSAELNDAKVRGSLAVGSSSGDVLITSDITPELLAYYATAGATVSQAFIKMVPSSSSGDYFYEVAGENGAASSYRATGYVSPAGTVVQASLHTYTPGSPDDAQLSLGSGDPDRFIQFLDAVTFHAPALFGAISNALITGALTIGAGASLVDSAGVPFKRGLSGRVSVAPSAVASLTIPVTFTPAFPVGVVPNVTADFNDQPSGSGSWTVRPINVTNAGFNLFASGTAATFTAHAAWDASY